MKNSYRVLPILALTAFVSCSDDGPRVIEEVRELTGEDQDVLIVESPAKRFRMPTETANASNEGNSAMPFVWQTPEGWEQQEGKPMRDLSFSIGEDGEGECYLSRLPGAGGGLVPNVNRWRGQMGLEPLSEEEIQELPKKALFGLEGTYVDVSGEFSGMGSPDAMKDYRMLGVILTSEAGAIFVKLTGPATLVDEHEANFEQFCASLQPRQGS